MIVARRLAPRHRLRSSLRWNWNLKNWLMKLLKIQPWEAIAIRLGWPYKGKEKGKVEVPEWLHTYTKKIRDRLFANHLWQKRKARSSATRIEWNDCRFEFGIEFILKSFAFCGLQIRIIYSRTLQMSDSGKTFHVTASNQHLEIIYIWNLI